MLAKDLSILLAQRVREIVVKLFPNGTKLGNEWCVGSLAGETGQSLKIGLTGPKAGVWCDFQDGSSGDLLDLWALKYNLSISEAMKEVSKYLNISIPRSSYEPIKKFSRPQDTNQPLLEKNSSCELLFDFSEVFRSFHH